MKIDLILDRIRLDLDAIKSNFNIREQYNLLESFLKKKQIQVIHSFTQIKRNEHFNGLVSETMFFDDDYIYDIVVGVDNIDLHIVLIKHISKINVATTPNYRTERSGNETNLQKIELKSQLVISYQEKTQLYYVTSPEKFGELLIISDILTKMISK